MIDPHGLPGVLIRWHTTRQVMKTLFHKASSRRRLTRAFTLPLALTWILIASPLQAAAPAGFAEPVRLRAGDGYVKTERPGYASPCLADVDGDGVTELLVGQFMRGKIRIYEPVADDPSNTRYDEGRWLEADGKVAEVPGVW